MEENTPNTVKAEGSDNNQEKLWYVVHTQTGHEDKVKEKILTQVKVLNFADRIFNVLVPTKEVIEVKQNRKSLKKRKFFPSYLLVEMILSSETYWFIRNITGVTGFLGDTAPVSLSKEEINGIMELTGEGPEYAVKFNNGEQVRIAEGPFKHFVGVIEEVNEARATPVELDYTQVEKIN